MSDSQTPPGIDRLARLARLALTDPERDLVARQFADILGYVAQVQAVATDGVPPMSHPHVEGAALRPDEVRPSLDRDAALDAAPDADRDAGFFKVPRVLGP
jgi:aspartyl-tRNA(Asn)/glutamyl-tRNA(Gln) amidotransferase subunit C